MAYKLPSSISDGVLVPGATAALTRTLIGKNHTAGSPITIDNMALAGYEFFNPTVGATTALGGSNVNYVNTSGALATNHSKGAHPDSVAVEYVGSGSLGDVVGATAKYSGTTLVRQDALAILEYLCGSDSDVTKSMGYSFGQIAALVLAQLTAAGAAAGVTVGDWSTACAVGLGSDTSATAGGAALGITNTGTDTGTVLVEYSGDAADKKRFAAKMLGYKINEIYRKWRVLCTALIEVKDDLAAINRFGVPPTMNMVDAGGVLITDRRTPAYPSNVDPENSTV